MGIIEEAAQFVAAACETSPDTNAVLEFCEVRDIDPDELRAYCGQVGEKWLDERLAAGGVSVEDAAFLVCLAFHVGYETAAKRYLADPLG
jgi:hypothetical protein